MYPPVPIVPTPLVVVVVVVVVIVIVVDIFVDVDRRRPAKPHVVLGPFLLQTLFIPSTILLLKTVYRHRNFS